MPYRIHYGVRNPTEFRISNKLPYREEDGKVVDKCYPVHACKILLIIACVHPLCVVRPLRPKLDLQDFRQLRGRDLNALHRQ